ncbi:histidine kinase [Candidatus Magnetomorum sp. HK-1]|nr:histidine kinase [Candidatus Magnetomorum sp. HK-1]
MPLNMLFQLVNALSEIKTLRGLLNICSYCKKIRDKDGNWQRIEKYIQDRSEAKFSHGMCDDCCKKFYPAVYEKVKGTIKNKV